MPIKPPLTPKPPETLKPQPDIITAFKIWAQGRTGLTLRELAESYSNSYSLDPTQRKNLFDYVAEQERLDKEREKLRIKKEADERKKREADEKKAEEKRKAEEEAKRKKTIKPGLIIERIDFPKWWKNLMVQEINLSDAGTLVIVDGSQGFRTFISSITLTVNGETVITFGFGPWGSSGPMYFGGDGQPMGIVIPMGAAPLPCGSGAFSVTSTGAGVVVGGFIVYSIEKW